MTPATLVVLQPGDTSVTAPAGRAAPGPSAAGGDASAGFPSAPSGAAPGSTGGGPSSAGEPKRWGIRYITDSSRFGTGRRNEPITVTVTATDAELPRAMEREVTGVYALDGWGGVANLASGVFGLDANSEFVARGGLREKSLGGPLAGDDRIAAMDAEVPADRRPLWDAFTAARRGLQKRVRETERAIEKAALEVARSRVVECQDLVLAEAMRYLSLAAPREQHARAVLAGGADDAGVQRLTGPDGPALVAQARRFVPMIRRIDELRTALLADRGLDAARVGAPLVLPTLAPLARLIPDPLDRTGEQALTTALAIASQTFTSEFTRAVTGFPLLLRLVGEDTTDDVALARAAATELQAAWRACHTVVAELSADTAAVWRLPLLIDLTVARRFGADATFASAVAADALRARGTQLTAIQIVNLLVQGADTALMFVPAPPVQLAMLLLSLVTGAAEVVETYVRDGVRRAADRAALDPSLAVGNAPSFLGLAVQAGLLALCVLPVPGLAAELKAARTVAP